MIQITKFILHLSKLLVLILLCSANTIADPIRIGVLTDLSGDMASWGMQSRVGVELALDEIRKEGGKIEVFYGDHHLQAKDAVSEFRKLLDFDKIDALYSEFTPTTVAIAPIARSKNILMIYAAAATSPLSQSDHFFKTYTDYTQGCEALAKNWHEAGIKKVGVLKATNEFGQICGDAVKNIFPDAFESEYNVGEDVSPQVLLLRSKSVEAIANVTFEADMLRMLKSLQNIGWMPQIGTQGDSITDSTISQFPSSLRMITYFSLPPLSEDFLTKLKKKDPNNSLVSVQAAGLAYLHIKQLFAALSSCSDGDSLNPDSPNPDWECSSQKLTESKPDHNTGFEGWKDRVAKFKISLQHH